MRLGRIGAFLASLLVSMPALAQDAAPVVDSGNTAWLLVSSALVMLMTPGLAFFYAGMVGRKNVVSTLLQNFMALAVVGLLWIIVGYSLVFTEGNGFIGGFDAFMLDGLMTQIYTGANVPTSVFVAFQMMFAIITPALITGSFAERVRFMPWMIILALWSLVVYAPVAHWVWGPGGWIAAKGGIDFAGGLVVHITAGTSALVAAILYGKRNVTVTQPNDISMVVLGAALLWFGWFGFNAGSALTSGVLAGHAFMTTFAGAAAALIGWMAVDILRMGKPTAIGASIGCVVGLVCVTPAAGFITLPAAIGLCLFAGIVCNLVAILVKKATKIDDALDVFACHGVGGTIGAIGTGMLASKAVNSSLAAEGILVSGESTVFTANLTAVVAVAAYSMIVTFIIIKIVGLFSPIRTTVEEETAGLDTTMHGEVGKHHDRSHL